MKIETATDFLATADEGAVLYQLHSWLCEPTHIERITVTSVERLATDGIYGAEPQLKCHYFSAGGSQTQGYVDDMLNRWHGVWTELQEALDYLNERRAAYKTDPELIAEHEEAAAMSRRWRDDFNWTANP